MTTAFGSYVTRTLLKQRANIGTADTADDDLIDLICDQVNMYVERQTGRILAPIGTATYYYDGDGSNRLYLPVTGDGTPIGGIRAVTTLEVARYTGAAYETVPAGDYFLRSRAAITGPYDVLYIAAVSGSYGTFPVGYDTVKLTGPAGWEAIPDDIAEFAAVVGIRAWSAREAGQSDIVGSDEFGRPVISRYVSGRDRDTLREYTLVGKLA